MRRFTAAIVFSVVTAFSGSAKADIDLDVRVVPPVYVGSYEMDDGYMFSEPVYVERVEPGLVLRVGPMVARLGETRIISGYHTRYYGYSPDLNRYYYYAPDSGRYYYYEVSDRRERRDDRDHDSHLVKHWDRDHDDDDD